MKELGDDARKSVDVALDDVSKANEQWKANAVKLKEELLIQVKQNISSLKSEASSARSDLVEKLRRETEAERSGLVGRDEGELVRIMQPDGTMKEERRKDSDYIVASAKSRPPSGRGREGSR
jgi:F0F1-type ATP synthase membrane subunit b/b'